MLEPETDGVPPSKKQSEFNPRKVISFSNLKPVPQKYVLEISTSEPLYDRSP